MKPKPIRFPLPSSWVWLLVFLLSYTYTGIAQTPPSNTAAVPRSLSFTAGTDQRFFFFNDSRNEQDRRVPVSVYGAQVGFLAPTRRATIPRRLGTLPAAYKAGLGFYFVNQKLGRPGILPETSASVTRRLRMLIGFYEPYLWRKGRFEVSLPLELGYGHSRYELTDSPAQKYELARGFFIPFGVGGMVNYHFPAPRWFRPLSWFGVNLLVGYRFTLKKDIPQSNINYSGFYGSIGPAFYLENLLADWKRWKQKRKIQTPTPSP